MIILYEMNIHSSHSSHLLSRLLIPFQRMFHDSSSWYKSTVGTERYLSVPMDLEKRPLFCMLFSFWVHINSRWFITHLNYTLSHGFTSFSTYCLSTLMRVYNLRSFRTLWFPFLSNLALFWFSQFLHVLWISEMLVIQALA